MVERMRRRSHLAVHVLDDDVVDGVGEIRRRAQRDSRSHRVPHERERRPCGIALEVLAGARDDVGGECGGGECILVADRGAPVPAEVQREQRRRTIFG